MARTSFYDIQINDLKGKAINLSEYKNKHILFVNVASKCGFTPQYESLEKLSNTYKNNLVVIGVPCNQFGNQEPGKASEIQEFCEINYGVSFLITEKIDKLSALKMTSYPDIRVGELIIYSGFPSSHEMLTFSCQIARCLYSLRIPGYRTFPWVLCGILEISTPAVF